MPQKKARLEAQRQKHQTLNIMSRPSKQPHRREIPVGETFEYKGREYKCVEGEFQDGETTCSKCAFKKTAHCMFFECAALMRDDFTDVVFKKIH